MGTQDAGTDELGKQAIGRPERQAGPTVGRVAMDLAGRREIACVDDRPQHGVHRRRAGDICREAQLEDVGRQHRRASRWSGLAHIEWGITEKGDANDY
jgi:hypothetical protein